MQELLSFFEEIDEAIGALRFEGDEEPLFRGRADKLGRSSPR